MSHIGWFLYLGIGVVLFITGTFYAKLKKDVDFFGLGILCLFMWPYIVVIVGFIFLLDWIER